MLKIFKRRDRTERKGSALLIVLGFLSFMIISAVAFAVYMRVERQASSNYRHSSSARHLLNAALVRAIDDIDSELRATVIRENNTPFPNKRKFPDWPGRVRNSAVVNSDDNEGDARVLTLDALSYIPGVLVNDVRKYATKPLDSEIDSNHTYKGPKWRAISMPDRNMAGDYAYSEAVVGRYAYTCINVSDMLNVNACKAAVRDLDRNRVSLAHLFASDSAADTFDNNVKNIDHRYSTLSDFYACMEKRSDPTFGSPYHYYLKQGQDVEFDYASKHILVTDGKAMAEPVGQGAFNLKDSAFSNLNADPPVLKPAFEVALNSALANSSADYNGQYRTSAFPYLLGDYLDTDNIPTSLDVPSVELAPMVCKIELTPQVFNIFKTSSATVGGTTVNTIYIDVTALPPQLFATVKTVYPFLRTDYRNNISTSFEIDVNAFLRIHSEANPAAGPCSIAPGTPSPADGYVVAYMNTPAANSFTPSANVRGGVSPYNVQPVNLSVVPLPGMPTTIPIWDSTGGPGGTFLDPRFPANSVIRITLYITFLGIKEAGSNNYVDAVPAFKPVPPTGNAAALQTRFVTPMSPHKLYFETGSSAPLTAGFNVNQPLNLVWTGLETPDPRFNYKISNWLQENTPINPNAHNSSTLDFLNETPNTGRDTDIFMSVSNAGELHSPGELGFIIRPFNYTPIAGPAVNFNNQTSSQNCEDKNAFFRTYRLYDHANKTIPAVTVATKRHDDLFQWFYSSNTDGSFNGMRVNPLSDIPAVLSAATENIPFDYWLANEITDRIANGNSVPTTLSDKNYSKLLTGTSWNRYTNGWYNCLIQARSGASINTDLSQNLRDIYYSATYFGWYSDASTLNQAFDPVTVPSITGASFPITLSQDLYGVDRKMIYSYTLDSFSDRQQLFLYIINAEATAASFGARARSLAGGRAIALVWRDPYPARKTPSDVPVLPVDLYPPADPISPWHQYYLGQNDRNYRKTDNDPDGLVRDRHYYEHKILFFKYLDR